MRIKSYNLIGTASLLTALVCAGIFVYTQWDLKRFNESLPKVPIIDTTSEGTPMQQEQADPYAPQRTALSIFEKQSESDILDVSALPAETKSVDAEPQSELAAESLKMFLEDSAEETETGEAGALEEFSGIPFNVSKVKTGFEAYNAYLASDPAYAYQRLHDAFREQFGDSSDVDILVETIRRSNNGTETIDDAIARAEALLRLMPGVSPPGGIQVVADHLKELKEAKKYAQETGFEIPFNTRHHFGE